jgi:hypothetical protein
MPVASYQILILRRCHVYSLFFFPLIFNFQLFLLKFIYLLYHSALNGLSLCYFFKRVCS